MKILNRQSKILNVIFFRQKEVKNILNKENLLKPRKEKLMNTDRVLLLIVQILRKQKHCKQTYCIGGCLYFNTNNIVP